MKYFSPLIALIFAFIALLQGPVQAANQLPRHLTFAVSVLFEQNVEVKTDNIGTSGGTSQSYGAAKTSKGTIYADILKVVSGADGGGIVVAIREDVRERNASTVNAVVVGNGAITYDPKSEVTPEEQQLLRMLTPGLVSAANLDAGRWNVQTPVGGGTLNTTYVVGGTDSAGHVELDVNGDLRVAGASPFTMSAHGSALYNARLLVPVSLSMNSRMREEAGGQYKVSDLNVDMTLVSDSFAPKT